MLVLILKYEVLAVVVIHWYLFTNIVNTIISTVYKYWFILWLRFVWYAEAMWQAQGFNKI